MMRSVWLWAALALLLIGAVAWAVGVSGPMFRWVTATQIGVGPGIGMVGGLGKLPVVQEMNPVAAAAADSVHAAITIPTGVTAVTTVTTAITHPDVYRTVSITGSAAAALSAVDIEGTKWDGTRQTETITGTGAATVAGNLPFKTVTKIKVHGVATPGGATYTIGCTEKLGLYRPIAAVGDVGQIDTIAAAGVAWVVTAGGGLPTGASVSATYDTVDPETTITADDGYLIYYNASAW